MQEWQHNALEHDMVWGSIKAIDRTSSWNERKMENIHIETNRTYNIDSDYSLSRV